VHHRRFATDADVTQSPGLTFHGVAVKAYDGGKLIEAFFGYY
jgi:hypothetical protein